MAHKTLLNGTAYGIKGGTTRISGTSYSVKKGKTLIGGTGYDVNFVPTPEASTLDGCSWANISEISEAGLGESYWSVGDTKSITISGDVGTLRVDPITLYVYILGFDHNSDIEGTGITFGTFKIAQNSNLIDVCLIDSMYNSYSTGGYKYFNQNHWGNYNYGGWKGCDARYDILGSTDIAPSGYGSAVTTSRTGYNASTTCATSPVANTLMAAMPSDLRAVMKPMTKYTDNTGAATNTAACVTASVDYLPLLAEYEIFGSRKYANAYEYQYQAQYAYFSAGNSRLKYRHNNVNSVVHWRERSPDYRYTTSFGRVYTDGDTYYTDARNSIGIAPIFLV